MSTGNPLPEHDTAPRESTADEATARKLRRWLPWFTWLAVGAAIVLAGQGVLLVLKWSRSDSAGAGLSVVGNVMGIIAMLFTLIAAAGNSYVTRKRLAELESRDPAVETPSEPKR